VISTTWSDSTRCRAVAPREGMLRFSPHLFNEDAEVDKVIELLARA
jgi:selenocysteine lyase/cysteine desulfurase